MEDKKNQPAKKAAKPAPHTPEKKQFDSKSKPQSPPPKKA